MKRSRWFAVAGVAAALCVGAAVPAATDAAPAGALVDRQRPPRAAALATVNAPTVPPVGAPLPDALPHTTRVTPAVLTRIVPAVQRPVIYYELKLGITEPPTGIISKEFDQQIRSLSNRWFAKIDIDVTHMYLEHIARHGAVTAERTVTYYLAMKSADPHTLVGFSRYCGFDRKDRTKPSQLAADLHKEPNVGTSVRITMVKVMEHEPRLQNGGEFNAVTGELIPVTKEKKGLSSKTVVIIIVSAVVGTVASLAIGLTVYFRMQAESAARYSPFTWMAERRRRSSAASSFQDRDSYRSADEGGAYEGRGAPSFSLSPPDGLERPARAAGAAAGADDEAGGYDSLEEGDDGDASSSDEERSDDGRGGEGGGRRARDRRGYGLGGEGLERNESVSSSSFCDSHPGSLPYMPPEQDGSV